MMHARAVATPLLQQRLYDEGLRVIEAGIEAIREFLDEYNQGHRAEECVELVSLERWREEILEQGAAGGGRAGRRAPRRFSARSSTRPSPPRSSRRPPGSAIKSENSARKSRKSVSQCRNNTASRTHEKIMTIAKVRNVPRTRHGDDHK